MLIHRRRSSGPKCNFLAAHLCRFPSLQCVAQNMQTEASEWGASQSSREFAIEKANQKVAPLAQ